MRKQVGIFHFVTEYHASFVTLNCFNLEKIYTPLLFQFITFCETLEIAASNFVRLRKYDIYGLINESLMSN